MPGLRARRAFMLSILDASLRLKRTSNIADLPAETQLDSWFDYI